MPAKGRPISNGINVESVEVVDQFSRQGSVFTIDGDFDLDGARRIKSVKFTFAVLAHSASFSESPGVVETYHRKPIVRYR